MTARKVMAKNKWSKTYEVYWIGTNIFYFIYLVINCICYYDIVSIEVLNDYFE